MTVFFVGVSASAVRAAEVTEAVVAQSFTNFATEFPAAFWRAGDAYFKSLGLPGHSADLKSFTNDNRATVLGLKTNPSKRWAGWLKLHDPNQPDDYWVLSFTYHDGIWRTLAGAKHLGKLEIDLYAQQLGSPSMKPFVDKEIARIQNAETNAQPAEAQPAKGKAKANGKGKKR